MATILTKKSDTSSSVPLAADLTNAAGGAELAVNTADKRLYSKTSGGSVVELGTNPSALSLPNGTANGVPYLNGSKVLTSGSALTFDGASLRLANAVGTTANGLRLDGGAQVHYWYLSDNVTSAYEIGSGAGQWKWLNSNGEQMRLTSTGLGIGTSSPAYKLDVSATGTTVSSAFRSDQSQMWIMLKDSGTALGNVRLGSEAGSFIAYANGNQLTLNSSGNLGLGVTPSAWSGIKAMQIGTAASFSGGSGFNDAFIASNAFYDGANWKYINSNPAYYTSIGGSAAARWYTAPSGTAGNAISFTQAMTLDASGNLVVGTTTFGQPNVNGAAIGSADGAFRSHHATGTSSGTIHAYFTYGGLGIGSIAQSGTTAVTYNTTSDYRLKTVIGAVSDAGQRIDALEPVEYEWKVNGERTRGFLAHKFQEVYAGSVTGTKDAVDKDGKPVYQAMQASSSEVIADLVAEIQSLRKRLAALESK